MRGKILLIFMLIVISLVALNAKAATLFLEPNGNLPTPGDFTLMVSSDNSFSLDVYISVPEEQYGGHHGLYGAGFYIYFDPTIIQVEAASLNGTIFNSTFSTVDIDTDNNRIFYYATMKMTEMGHYGDILIGTVQFSPVSIGTAVLTTSDYSNYPDFMFFDGTTFDEEVEFCGGVINVVPIPTTLFLLGSGLIGVIALRRKVQR